MFASLKNKIKEETGNDVAPLAANRNRRSRPESLTSVNSVDELSLLEQRDAEVGALRHELQELTGQIGVLRDQCRAAEDERGRLEESNKLMEDSLRVCQVQKDLLCEEQDKIQNFQHAEIAKLKNMLLFREQEAVDRIVHQKNAEQQLESMKHELNRLRGLEAMLEDVQDQLENLRHSSQIEKNNLVSTLAAVEEENRHLKGRVQVLEDTRVTLTSGSNDNKIQCLLQERKLLEQRLEEAHLHLSDIKSSWSGQNLALETQVNRLSRQVAEETTEKHKALKRKDDLIERLKQYEVELEKARSEVTQRDNKIKLMNEEIDELNAALRESREQHDEEVTFMNSKLEQLQGECDGLRTSLGDAERQLMHCEESADRSTGSYQDQLMQFEQSVRELNRLLTCEKQEKLSALMKNAEISQQEEILKQELRHEKDEAMELQERVNGLQRELDKRLNTVNELRKQIDELMTTNLELNAKQASLDSLHAELVDKNKIIKILNQRLVDMKKTLQEELKNSTQTGHSVQISTERMLERTGSVGGKMKENGAIKQNGTTAGAPIVMDEVNFRYLKHVIIKFLTSREVEARHLIKAVATLLQLSYEEEKLLQDTLTWKMSWFGSRPGHGAPLSPS